MMQNLRIFLIFFGFVLSFNASAMSKQKALKDLSELKKEVHQDLVKTEKAIRETIDQGHQAFLINPKSALETTDLDIKMLRLVEKRKELQLQQQFYDQLTLAFHKNYRDQSAGPFLLEQLKNIAYQEAISSKPDQQKWRFLSYLSTVLQSVPTEDRNLLSFVAQYTKTSSISQPISPTEFLSSHHYSNGVISRRARQTNKTEVGDDIDQLLNELDKSEYEKKHLSPPKLLPPSLKPTI